MYHNTEPALSVGFSSNNTLPGNINHIEWSYWVICSLQAPFVVLQLLSSKQITAGVGFTNLFFFFNFCTCLTSHWIPLRSLFQVILTNMLSSYCLPDTLYLLVSRSPLLPYKPIHLPLAPSGHLWSSSGCSKCGVSFLTVTWSLVLAISTLTVSTNLPSSGQLGFCYSCPDIHYHTLLLHFLEPSSNSQSRRLTCVHKETLCAS